MSLKGQDVIIAVAGSYGVGMTMRVSRAPESGETVSGGELSVGHGGKGSNQAVGMARLGAEVKFFTGIGDDSAGKSALELWRGEGIDASHVVVGRHPTMTGFIIVDAEGENRIAIAPGALADLEAGSVEQFKDDIRMADLLVVSLEIPLEAAFAALRMAREAGVRTLLNPAPAVPFTDETLACVDVLTPNLREAEVLLGFATGSCPPADLARELSARFDGQVVLTAGADGVYVQDGATAFHLEALPVASVVDTTGAGDAFTAALSVALAEGQSLTRAVRFAAAAGAHAVTIPEVIPSLPGRHDLDLRLTSTPIMKE